MKTKSKLLCMLACIGMLSACSSGSSSGGGEDATGCVQTSENGITNTCDYDINIDAGAGVESIAAGQTIQPRGAGVFISACRAPSIPQDEGALDFSCQ